MSKKIGNIEFYAGPDQVGAPDGMAEVIIKFIDGAKRKLDIAVQELDHEPIAQAIVAARKRGVRVRLIVELDYLRDDKPQADPFAAGGGREINRTLQNAILRSAVPVYSDFNSNIFHQKFIVRDGSAVLTGSTNFTTTGTTQNLNHLVVINSKGCGEHLRQRIQGGATGRVRQARWQSRSPPEGGSCFPDPHKDPLRAGPQSGNGDHEADGEGTAPN